MMVWIVVGLCTDSSNGAEIDVFIRFTEMQESYGEEQRDRGLKGAILVVQETTEK